MGKIRIISYIKEVHVKWFDEIVDYLSSKRKKKYMQKWKVYKMINLYLITNLSR